MAGDPIEALETLWRPAGLKVADLPIRADGTVAGRAGSDRNALRSERRGKAPARVALAGRPDDEGDELAVHEELGRGGMGVVHLATQRALRRAVAVKRALDPAVGSDELVEEAWALAHLAHPNVVPVHALVRLGGAPALVMKRIEGTLFADVLARPADHAALTEGDPLAFHLRTLIEVTRALEHAHRAGVVHLDLKPANVMIGHFGEVYVLDWGLAARIGDEPAHLPRAADIQGVAGTPDCMAPEVAMGAGAKIDARTDVYLLGSMLHEILTGRPRHAGKSPIERIYRACLSEPPTLDPSTPAALADLVRRATHKDPAERPASAEAFRRTLEDHLAHREADQLFERGTKEAEALEEALAAPAIDRAAVHRHFGAARFALDGAPAARAEEAKAIRARIHHAMAAHAIGQGELALAASYLDESGAEAPELRARLEAARRQGADEARQRERLLALGREADLGAGRAIRGPTIAALAATFLVSNLAMGAFERGVRPLGYPDIALVAVFAIAVAIPIAWAMRRQLFPNRAAIGLWGVALSALAVAEVNFLVGYLLGVPFHAALALTPLFYSLCFGALSTLLDARLWPAALLQAPTAILAVLWPEWVFEIVGIGGSLGVLHCAIVWWRDARRHA